MPRHKNRFGYQPREFVPLRNAADYFSNRQGRASSVVQTEPPHSDSADGSDYSDNDSDYSSDESASDSDPVRHATLYVDGAARSNHVGPSGAGAVLYDYGSHPQSYPDRRTYSRYLGVGGNNRAEYEALIFGLQKALDCGVTHLTANSDSQLVVQQVNRRWRVKSANLRPLCSKAQQLAGEFESFTLFHIPRDQNTEADAMAIDAINEFLTERELDLF